MYVLSGLSSYKPARIQSWGSESFGPLKNPVMLCDRGFVLISDVGYGAANYGFCLLQIVDIWNSGDS